MSRLYFVPVLCFRAATICAALCCACTVGCSEWRVERDADGSVRLIVRGDDTGERYVPAGVTITDPETGEHTHADVPGYAEWAHAAAADTPEAWADAGRKYQEGTKEAFRRAKSAKGRLSGTEARAGDAFRELDARTGEAY